MRALDLYQEKQLTSWSQAFRSQLHPSTMYCGSKFNNDCDESGQFGEVSPRPTFPLSSLTLAQDTRGAPQLSTWRLRESLKLPADHDQRSFTEFVLVRRKISRISSFIVILPPRRIEAI